MCGIFGAIRKNKPISEDIYKGLIHLQHRGQDACGIYVFDPRTQEEELSNHKGLLRDAFLYNSLPLKETAEWGIGHVRYSTVGAGGIQDIQPLVAQDHGRFAIAYNGNIVNYLSLKEHLEKAGCTFHTHNDAEVILHLMHTHHNLFQSIEEAMRKLIGAYSVVGIDKKQGLFAFRDPHGIKPLLLGSKSDEPYYAISSETEALKWVGCDHIEMLKPGEAVWVDREFTLQRRQLISKPPALCSFEFAYFARPNTILNGDEIYRKRIHLGKALGKKAKEQGWHADVILPVPESGRPAAIAMAREMDIPLEEGFIKKAYAGRTFLLPTQKARMKGISRKFSLVQSVFKDKRIILVDDSIVRGSVSKAIVAMARDAGATWVGIASSFPPIRHPCFYGIDFPDVEQLIAHARTLSEICEQIGADAMLYLNEDEYKEALGRDDLCMACINGKYPTEIEENEELTQLRRESLAALEKTLEVEALL